MSESRAELLRRFEREAVPLIGRVLRVAMKFTGRESEAEDLVQDTYVRAMERFHQFKPGTNLLAWLNRIAYTQFVNRYHKQGLRRAGVLKEALDSPLEPAFDPDPEAVEQFGKAVSSAHVRERVSDEMAHALDSLSPELRDILVLCVVGELSYKDAAEVLVIPVGTVMSRLSRARLAMRAELIRRMPADAPVIKAGGRK